MSELQQVIQLLLQRVNQWRDGDEARISLPLIVNDHFDSLDWLTHQPHFPKCYWQTRDGREEVLALAQVRTFTDPLAAYTVLGSQQRVWGGRAFDDQQAKTRHQSCYFFLPQIELIREDKNWSLNVNISSDKQRTVQALKQLVVDHPSLAPLTPQPAEIHFTPQYPEWQHIVDLALQSIEQKQFDKVVLARKTRVELKDAISGAQLLKASKALNHDSFHFLLAFSPNHCFLGSTPERLYLRSGEALETEALAGTIGRSQDVQEDAILAQWLLNDEKNRRENQFVVDDIVERLTPFVHNIEVQAQPELIQLRQVQHLKRKIFANLFGDIKGVQLLSALQPTAAIAGLPRDESIQFIRLHEPFTRGWYSGSVGYFSLERAQFCVAIRSALIQDNMVKLYAGAGIVTGSKPEYEWQELNRKTATLLSLLTDTTNEPLSGDDAL